MPRNTTTRDKNIYMFSQTGSSVEHLSGKYGLKPTTIKKIIKKSENSISEKEEFIYNMEVYIRKNYSALTSTNIINSLKRYFSTRDILFIKEVKDTIKDIISKEKHVRGIGDKYINILSEYFKTLSL